MKIKLERDWKDHSKGDVLSEDDRPRYTLEFLKSNGWACDVTIPTDASTVKEIKQYLDGEGIEYSSSDRKEDLLNLCRT